MSDLPPAADSYSPTADSDPPTESRPPTASGAPTDSCAPPPVVILCGGRGTRLRERTEELPKPLVEIGGMPILWHVIQLYACQGFRRFMLATGYKGAAIERFAARCAWPDGVEVQCVKTGLQTPTGGRIKRLQPLLAGRRFCLTYADGLADVDLLGLLRFHEDHGAIASMTVVRPELQFGVAQLHGEDSRVLGFVEKPRSEHWMNGGFLCFEPDVFRYLRDEDALERAPLARLAADGQLHARRHEGFWGCMDTYKDAVALNDMWASGGAPWRLWGSPAAAEQGPAARERARLWSPRGAGAHAGRRRAR